jgi:hypothetical protein
MTFLSPHFCSPPPLPQVDIINADNGIFISGSDFVSVRYVGIKVESARWKPDTQPDNGHHAISLGRSGDVSVRL